MPTIITENFDLYQTIFSGQTFRWDRVKDECFGLIKNIPIRLLQSGSKLHYESYQDALSKKDIQKFLGLNHPLDRILRSIAHDDLIKKAIAHARGLRVVRSDPFECLISFITSSYSNIPRIRRSLDLIAKRRSSPITFMGRNWIPFPKRTALLNLRENTIRTCGLGYRAPYLKKAFKIADEEFLLSVEKSDYEGGKDLLMQIPGVGEKVADCTLLFGFGSLGAFPVDVWIARVMQHHYFEGEQVTHRKMREFAAEYFGEYAGYAQQYLFHFARLSWQRFK